MTVQLSDDSMSAGSPAVDEVFPGDMRIKSSYTCWSTKNKNFCATQSDDRDVPKSRTSNRRAFHLAYCCTVFFYSFLTAVTIVSGQDALFQCPRGWSLRGLHCYQFFNVRHSWYKASELCSRYGSALASVESFRENNFTASIASVYLMPDLELGLRRRPTTDDDAGSKSNPDNFAAPRPAYWLGLQTYNELQTNTLEADAGHQISQYYGHWGENQPRVEDGKCVRSVILHDGSNSQAIRQQVWELTSCEELLPFMCQVKACPTGTVHCSNAKEKKCVNIGHVCDGEDDCGDGSDELNCPERCQYHLESSGDIIQSPNYPAKYRPFSSCKWILEGPRGTNIILQFSEFDTEHSFDTVQILGGGRTEETAINIETLSGDGHEHSKIHISAASDVSNSIGITSRTFVSASNFMIIKFKTDGSVEKRGFRASWRTEAQNCGGDLFATVAPQMLTSPNYPREYPGGLECLHLIIAPAGQIVTMEVEDLDMEPERDFLLIRDGPESTDNVLAKLTGSGPNPEQRFIYSTGNIVYVYMRTDQADSRHGFKIRFHQGCRAVFTTENGTIASPAFGIREYPHNQKCVFRIRHGSRGRLSLRFDELDLHKSDSIKVYDGENGLRLHPGSGFTGRSLPPFMLSAESGEMVIKFTTDSLQSGKGFHSHFSADCPPLQPGSGALSSSLDTVFGSRSEFTCPPGFIFATGVATIVTECMPGGIWSQPYIPSCQEVYCGPVPQIDNGFAIDATNVSLAGQASYQCYAGFAFASGNPLESIKCSADGEWSHVPSCQASQCPPLGDVEHASVTVLTGRGLNYGTIVRYECDTGYQMTSKPVLLCQSNGTWSSSMPSCSRVKCDEFPNIENGYIVDRARLYSYGDQALVDCHRGYNRIGSNIIICGANETFENAPRCEDKNECDSLHCDAKSTKCENVAGSHHCKCRGGFTPNLECRPVVELGMTDGGIADASIIVSGEEPSYEKELIRLKSRLGWCGTSKLTGVQVTSGIGNWVTIDLKAPTVIRGFKTQGVRRLDGTLAFPTAIRLAYTNDLADTMREFRNTDRSPVEFRVLDGSSTSIMNMPVPIEARYLRLNLVNFTGAPCMRLELMGCQKQSCSDSNECLTNNGGCDQRCINSPGSFDCMCNAGYELFTKDGTSNFFIADGETGLRDGDLYRLNKSCVPVMCPRLQAPANGHLLAKQKTYRYGDMVKFDCEVGYVLRGNASIECTTVGEWSARVPTCQAATCTPFASNPIDGLQVEYHSDEVRDAVLASLGRIDPVEGGSSVAAAIPFMQNITFSCNQTGRKLRGAASASFRQCVYDPQPGRASDYWLSGARPACEPIDCGLPPAIPGADYGDFIDTKYKSSFFFGCKDEAFRLVGQSSLNDNVVRCQADGVWDFGDMRCEGPVCEDPMRPPDGVQISTSYEQGSEVKFHCSKEGYIPINPSPIKCVDKPECKVIKALGITSGRVPDSAINATSERLNYEARNIRLNSATGWCGKKEAFAYVNVDLGKLHRIKSILIKGVVTGDVVGRPNEIRFFYKEREQDNYVLYPPNFNLTSRDPGHYGELAMYTLPQAITARFVILGIVSFNENPCLKFELTGCEVDDEEARHLGFDNGYPICVDNEPPVFTNCPTEPIEVSTGGPDGLAAVDFPTPAAFDNSGSIARMEVITITEEGRSEGFIMPVHTFKDMKIEYAAYDFDGNVAICQVNITVRDVTAPSLQCPDSFVVELVEESEEYNIDFRKLRNKVISKDPSGEVALSFVPERASVPLNSYHNVTVLAVDDSGNLADCHFQVAIKPTPCVEWDIQAPAYGSIQCSGDRTSDGLKCVATCRPGFRFTDGDEQKVVSCRPGAPWLPSRVVPDCVSEDTTLSTYDVVATITYRGNGAVPSHCPTFYVSTLKDYLPALSNVLTDRCAAGSGGMDIRVSVQPLEAIKKADGMNVVDIKYTMSVSPALPQPRIYDLCGQTHDLIFDLSIQQTNELIKDYLEVSGDGQSCPLLRALRSEVHRGFVCQTGEVLNKIRSSEVPHCLECPAGFFGSKGEETCTRCPLGTFQDKSRQGSCKSCPPGTWTKDAGSKSSVDCVPVCGFGTYSPSGLVPCLECPNDQYTEQPPQDGFKSCATCPEATYTFQTGAMNASDCRPKCAPGFYSDTGLAPCHPCPTNFFQSLEGQRECFECHSTERTLGVGSTSKEECKNVICSDGVCENGGLCVPVNHGPKCFCPAGFEGVRCEVDVDECASSPCYNGGSCIDKPQGYRCECPLGYSGLQCIEEESGCASNPCPSRAMCKSLPPTSPKSGPGFTCLCRTGYTGEDCDITVDPCTADGNPCQHDGECLTLEQGRYKCECTAGWDGVHCEQDIDDCAEIPCLLGANCTDLINDFQCDCPKGFGGKRCQTKIDMRSVITSTGEVRSPCVHGEAIDVINSYKCLCDSGWTGSRCDVNIDECASQPCENGGQCIDSINDYSCLCQTSFDGKQCQHAVDHCAVQPCQNGGTCSNEGEGFFCDCRPGYVGLTCEAEIDECATNACDPTGTVRCLDKDNAFECECRDGFVGKLCETDIDECANQPCRNGATCIDKMGEYECICPVGWTGQRCEADVRHCSPSHCMNDAECVDLFNDYFCVCPRGTDGKRCETAPERCIGSPCMNDGICTDFGSGLNCSCPAQFTGLGCQLEYDACADNICQHGGTCTYTESLSGESRSYQCECPQGFEGRHCEINIDDCSARSGICPHAATCIDLVDDVYCQCPFNLTGEDCRKSIDVDYDLHFIDDTKSSSASLAVPFHLDSPAAISVGMWVQFDTPGETGTYFTLFAVDSPYQPTNKRVIMQAMNSGVYVNLFPGQVGFVYLQFPAYVPIANGKWHHVVVTWTQDTGTLTLVSDGLIADKREQYGGPEHLLPEYGYITLGSAAESSDGRTRTESGFHGKLTRVQLWNRVLNPATEIPLQVRSCRAAPILFDGLILRWSGYDRTLGGIERIMPSVCDLPVCPPGSSGDHCEIVDVDKVAPVVERCPSNDIWVAAPNGSTVVSWVEPVFSDNVRVDRIINTAGLRPGTALQLGTYDAAYVAYDPSGNSVECSFKIYVIESFCPPLDPPQGGSQSCNDWGPGGRFKICQISCNEGLLFSSHVPQYYTCGAEGFWRPHPDPANPTAPFVYPACSKSAPAQKIVKLRLDYLTDVLCNDAGKGVLKARIIAALESLNKEWNFSSCDRLTERECNGLGININCNSNSKSSTNVGSSDSGSDNVRIKRDLQSERQGRQVAQPTSDDSSKAYQLEISFPTVDSDDITNTVGQTERIERLLQSIILEQNELNVNDTLPNVQLDRSSISIEKKFTCSSGEVVINNQCVNCPSGTSHDEATNRCDSCPVGTYSEVLGQLQCRQCPLIQGKPGVTETIGATDINMCKERCPVGQYYDKIINLCRPCGYGKFQPDEGKFTCELCGLGQTTRSKEAISRAECRDECTDGRQLGHLAEIHTELAGNAIDSSDDSSIDTFSCIPCPVGTYRTKGLHLSCQRCPDGFTSSSEGSVTVEACSLPICQAGSFLNSSINECQLCARGSYQDEAQQTFCNLCPHDTATAVPGANSKEMCTNRCHADKEGAEALCDKNANCHFLPETNDFMCKCKPGYRGSGAVDDCTDRCTNYCKNEGQCLKDKQGNPYCQCVGSFTGKRCGTKSTFAYVASGIAGSVIFVIVLVLLIWMICVRANRSRSSPEKILSSAAEQNGSQVNFYYGAPAPYAESIAPSHHSAYAHYYDDEEDGWEMPNFYNESYMKDGLHSNKLNSLARSNASIYMAGQTAMGPTPSQLGGMKSPGSIAGSALHHSRGGPGVGQPDNDLYDRLRRHTYMAKKSEKGNETTSDSDGQ